MTALEKFARVYELNHQYNFHVVEEYLENNPNLMLVSACRLNWMHEICVWHKGKRDSFFGSSLLFDTFGPAIPECSDPDCPHEVRKLEYHSALLFSDEEEHTLSTIETFYSEVLKLPTYESNDDQKFLGYALAVSLY